MSSFSFSSLSSRSPNAPSSSAASFSITAAADMEESSQRRRNRRSRGGEKCGGALRRTPFLLFLVSAALFGSHIGGGYALDLCK